MKVLIVEDEEALRDCLKRIVAKNGHEAHTAGDGATGLELFDQVQPDLVISDVQMPRMDGLKLLEEIRKRNSDTIVVIVTGVGTESIAISALRLGANNYLWKPLTSKDLVPLLRKYQSLVTQRTVTRESAELVTERRLKLVLDNRMVLSTGVARLLVQEAGDMLFEKDRLDVTLGLDEIITNAIEHGNLGVTFEEKDEALGGTEGMSELYRKRLEDPVVAARRVRIEFEAIKGEYCQWVIADEGQGFKWDNLPNPLDEDRLLCRCGRGIFLARLIFDEVEYLGCGNRVRIRKYAREGEGTADDPGAE